MEPNINTKKLSQDWFVTLDSILPYVFEILTPQGSGTGFQLFVNKGGLCGIATAHHVINHSHEWGEPIKIIHHKSQKEKLLKEESRAIFIFADQDLAFIVFNRGDLPIEVNSPEMIDPKANVKQGVEIGWCGFPAVAPPHKLCFFAGHVSCYLATDASYLVDGIAIHGVSGGPAFYYSTSGKPKICGVISAYRANRVTGEALPGLSIVRSVESYRATLEKLKSLEDAEEKVEEQKKQQSPEIAVPSEPIPPSPKVKRIISKVEKKKVKKK